MEVIMSRSILCIAAAVATIFLGGVASGDDAPPVDLKKDNAELRQEVQRLQSEVKALQARVARAEAREEAAQAEKRAVEKMKLDFQIQKYVPRSTTQPAFVLPSRGTSSMPPGTVEQQFNGIPVYIIPLGTK
jgi:outer membrane murein-binding lipoprotein Lpp